MSINKLISIKVPVLEALGDMGLDHGKMIPTLTTWAARAEKEIGSYYSYKRKIAVLTVKKWRCELPCDAVYAQRVLLGDYGCDSADLFDLVCSVGSANFTFRATDTFLIVDNPGVGNSVAVGSFKWEVQDNHIVFSADYDKQKITVQYLGLATDEEGFPMVCENHVEAIIEYIMYRYAKRSRFTANKMELGDVVDMRRQWGTLAAEARAMDSEISESDRNEMISMIHDPLIGYGMELGLHTPGDFTNNYFP